ncbi:MAG: Trk system potassium transporter TrkA [Zunongwangia sp.]|jgi:trk system potassium uptake protein TrkA|uniref:Trk system potassium uptake protein TrkA n=2 Tax=Zunongwangia profunda TaxID=398743 RepID=D5BHB0_ZUNPS|nr:Trk system potassium transporter TrkA [Zunongwangia profunda]MAC63743.1 Trk system potassium transporter TrkA [Flavobacteriaceae bacterium]MAO38448.1 Trk system potassium transporter TrkA [Zunongwangia sp.]ADF51284.1 potassium transporter peripheral membrane component [Zunongwangia profunda SM-A87]MAG88395.1 Trk system potassium transporter TrkA [Flavobacteriaceae bacterium]MAS69090.1 Trk system potassium transporter TrkA [Zunongwangia sp.]|tara:strand:- start:5221 stop:6570 length:1350 start_codon:yes stop_codon:yes gene_type:complete
MKIIIAGAGEVGFHLAKLLSFESQDITLIDPNRDRLQYADTHLDIRTIKGDASSIAILKEAQVKYTDMLISVTSSEATNITVCVLAKQLGAMRTIARISNTEFLEKKEEIGFTQFGIDELISPEALAAREIGLLLNQSAFNDSYEFEEGALTMIGLSLSRTARFVGKTVKEAARIFPQLNFVPIAIQRFGTQYTLIPRGDTQFKEGDQVYFITLKSGVEELYKLTGKTKQEIKSVMILGGSKIGRKTARDLCRNNFNVKLVETSKDKAYDLADELPNTLIIHGDGRNVELLEEENIHDMDAFIAVTGNSETNIMSCLVAKSKSVKKTISLVENMDYFQLSHSIGIDTLINKKLLAANNIFRYIRKGEVVAMTKLNNMNAELLEFIVKPGSQVADKKIKNLDFPRSAIIGGIIRHGEGIIALGEFLIKPGDRIVVCCLPRSIKKVEKLFL